MATTTRAMVFPKRNEYNSLLNSYARCYCMTNFRLSGTIPAPWAACSPVSVKDCRWAFHSGPFSHPDPKLPHNIIVPNAYETRQKLPTYDHTTEIISSLSEWEKEGHRMKSLVMREKAVNNIAHVGPSIGLRHGHGSSKTDAASLHVNSEERNSFSATYLIGNTLDKSSSNGATRNPQGLSKVFNNVQTIKSVMSDITTLKELSSNGAQHSSTVKLCRSSRRKKEKGQLTESLQECSMSSMFRSKPEIEEPNGSLRHDVEENVLETEDAVKEASECSSVRSSLKTSSKMHSNTPIQWQKKFLSIFDTVLVVDNISAAEEVVQLLTTKYRDHVHACDTEVSKIDVKQETPVDHGEVICFSIFCGPEADFGNGKSCIWVDVLDGESNILMVFAPFFEDPSIKKVWHNYSFDHHVIANYGIKVRGFHADTMHLARLWNSSRQINGGYSLEALTSDPEVMREIHSKALNDKNDSITSKESSIMSQTGKGSDLTVGKISMKDIFGKKKLKKDGSEGKVVNVAPVEVLQREERIPWICYSSLDAISTLKLHQSLKSKLVNMKWILDGQCMGNMYDFYEKYWCPFGNLLVEMEAEGMLVDRAHLSEIEKVAISEQQVAADKFRNWASDYCADAKYMNVGSDIQIRQLFFGGIKNNKQPDVYLPTEKTFKVPNVDNIIEEGKKFPTKFRNITLTKIVEGMEAEIYTPSGWPSVSGDALKIFAGKVSPSDAYLADGDFQADNREDCNLHDMTLLDEKRTRKTAPNSQTKDSSAYGTAFTAFGGGDKGRDACHAITALCNMCSIDSLISNFILPLQGNQISGKDGRIHCSLNINTETGRLSARRPNLQNPPALEKDRYKIREAFVAAPGNSLIVADYGQLELRILAHLTNCKSMLEAFKAGGDFHSRTAMNMYDYIREDVAKGNVLLEWNSEPGQEKPPVPLLKDAFASERRKAKMLNFSIAYGKTPVGLAKDWKVSIKEAKETVKLWYKERKEVLVWQEMQKKKALEELHVHTILGRARNFPYVSSASSAQRGHIERAAINAPVQGSAADVAMCAMLQIAGNVRLKQLKWKLLLQVHDEVILEGPSESAEEAKAIVVECLSKPFDGHNFLKVDLSVDAKYARSWYAAK